MKKFFKQPLVRYVFVGGISYIAEMLTLYVCSTLLGLSSIPSVTISFWIGFVLSFILQKVVAFSNKERALKRLFWQSASYAILVLANYLFSIATVAMFDSITGIYIARTIALIITTSWNYVIYSKLIFKKRS